MNERLFNVWFVLCGLAGLAWLGIIIWLAIRVVNWLTAQTL